jgi:hypothetical protein
MQSPETLLQTLIDVLNHLPIQADGTPSLHLTRTGVRPWRQHIEGKGP